jgi:hypothetical protein
MQNRDWIDLFRLIPLDQHNTLVLTTASGMDVNLDTILRTEQDYLVFRGRVAGNTEDGRVFFLPYRQIDFLHINRQVKEVEIREMYGALDGERGEVSSPDSPPQRESSQGLSPAPTNRAEAPAAGGKRLSNPPAPATSPTVVAPVHGSAQGIAARLSMGPGAAPTLVGRVNASSPPPAGQSVPVPRNSNLPTSALVPPGATNGDASATEQASPPRNSILERLRAQRNSILPPRPPGR